LGKDGDHQKVGEKAGTSPSKEKIRKVRIKKPL